jgi:hypothetical protein
MVSFLYCLVVIEKALKVTSVSRNKQKVGLIFPFWNKRHIFIWWGVRKPLPLQFRNDAFSLTPQRDSRP